MVSATTPHSRWLRHSTVDRTALDQGSSKAKRRDAPLAMVLGQRRESVDIDEQSDEIAQLTGRGVDDREKIMEPRLAVSGEEARGLVSR